jgi:hypothetical protein
VLAMHGRRQTNQHGRRFQVTDVEDLRKYEHGFSANSTRLFPRGMPSLRHPGPSYPKRPAPHFRERTQPRLIHSTRDTLRS